MFRSTICLSFLVLVLLQSSFADTVLFTRPRPIPFGEEIVPANDPVLQALLNLAKIKIAFKYLPLSFVKFEKIGKATKETVGKKTTYRVKDIETTLKGLLPPQTLRKICSFEVEGTLTGNVMPDANFKSLDCKPQ